MDRASLTEHLIGLGVLRSASIIAAFRAIDRMDFVPEAFAQEGYEDVALPIDFGQTISQPYTVAFMLELLQPAEENRVLDIGSGSGWTTALLAHIVGPKGCVIGLELVPELVSYGSSNLEKYHFAHAEIRQAETLGAPDEKPFDRTLVSAAGTEIPNDLITQLTTRGVLVMPVDSAIVRVQKKTQKDAVIERHEGFAFVPLIY